MKNGVFIIIVVLLIIILIIGCGLGAITEKELEAIKGVIPDINKSNIEMVKLNDDIAKKFPAVKKIFEIKNEDKNDYAFVVTPVGFRGHINTVVIIDGKQDQIKGIEIIEHEETLIYAESLTESWFLDRFKNKSIKQYLRRVILETDEPDEIVQITAATISTQAVINGVNSAIGAYHELALHETAEPVPLKVEEFVTGVE